MKRFARECGFELAGIAAAEPHADYARFEAWTRSGHAGEMAYLTDRRGPVRAHPRNLLAKARSIVCVGKLYNRGPSQSGISRYALGPDYHDVVREGLMKLAGRIVSGHGDVEWRACADTAPLLERSYAAAAGLGWIGKNTCLINQEQGSWFFLGELLLSVEVEADSPAPRRCGTCTRCVDACPTGALIAGADGSWGLDARRCISYLTIEKRGLIDLDLANGMGQHVFGCDICQEVCPWNYRAPLTSDFGPLKEIPEADAMATLNDDEFRDLFRHSPVWRAKYEGFLRNVAIALGNRESVESEKLLGILAGHPNAVVAATAERALSGIRERLARLPTTC